MATTGKPASLAADYFPQSLREKYHITDDSFETSTQDPSVSADINWVPDANQYDERSKAALASDKLKISLPIGYPEAVTGPLAWTGSELNQNDYVLQLSSVHHEEIARAVKHFKGTGLELENLTESAFPLPQLGPVLKLVSLDVHNGHGFKVIRGLDPQTFSREENVILYLGLSSYIGGERGRQNLDGNLMTHITDLSKADVPVWERRPIYSNLAQPFHTDVICHILGLYYLSTARTGGETYLAPSWSVYNELASNRPDIIHSLAKSDWTHDTFGLNPPCYQRALLHLQDGKPILNFSRRILTGAPMTPRTPNIPPISEAQAEALDILHFLAHKNSIKLNLQTGDICFVNNLAVMHSRAAFQDVTETHNHTGFPNGKRYVLRLWLNNPELGWNIPSGLKLAWDRIFARVPEIHNYIDIDPFVDEHKMNEHAGPKGGGGSGGTGRSSDCG